MHCLLTCLYSRSFLLAATLKDAREIVNLSQKAKTVVAVNENWAYHPLSCAVAEYVQKVGIGEVSKFYK